uniref:DNA-directed RNA polymerase subunit N n=1 Tax=viral metagenome TaxID=1070528 RepID=A0A6C0F8D3_9ZZZZ|tara:strand:- start:5843 stop:6112 length:270 start_codon:yes stop_codon:yes gene_type:complete
MIIPMRCFTCGEILADKWVPYITAIQEEKNKTREDVDPESNDLELRYIDVHNPKPEVSIEGNILNEMNLHKYCCRRMMLGNVHIVSYLA